MKTIKLALFACFCQILIAAEPLRSPKPESNNPLLPINLISTLFDSKPKVATFSLPDDDILKIAKNVSVLENPEIKIEGIYPLFGSYVILKLSIETKLENFKNVSIDYHHYVVIRYERIMDSKAGKVINRAVFVAQLTKKNKNNFLNAKVQISNPVEYNRVTCSLIDINAIGDQFTTLFCLGEGYPEKVLNLDFDFSRHFLKNIVQEESNIRFFFYEDKYDFSTYRKQTNVYTNTIPFPQREILTENSNKISEEIVELKDALRVSIQ